MSRKTARVLAWFAFPFVMLFGLAALPFYKLWLRVSGREITVSDKVAEMLVSEHLQTAPDGVFALDIITATKLPVGQTYTTLNRLKAKGLVKGSWVETLGDRQHPRRLYRWVA